MSKFWLEIYEGSESTTESSVTCPDGTVLLICNCYPYEFTNEGGCYKWYASDNTC